MDIKEIVRDIVRRELREGGMQAVPVGRLEGLEARLTALEGAPRSTPPGPAPGPEFAALEARLTALESALGINSEDAP